MNWMVCFPKLTRDSATVSKQLDKRGDASQFKDFIRNDSIYMVFMELYGKHYNVFCISMDKGDYKQL